MKAIQRLWNVSLHLSAALALSVLCGVAAAADVSLSGDDEVPPVKTAATGSGTITVAADGAVSGSVKTTGVMGTAAHIHLAAKGKNGPVIITLTRVAGGEWTVPAGARLNAEQMKSFRAGELYVNVHSDANRDGEIRAQLAP
ncbi:MAG: CHRD domain-containing protein [Pseudomonadota bacterium]